MVLSNEGIIVILFVGLVAGWLAGQIVRGTGFGIIGDILVGIAGALIASLLFPKLGIRLGSDRRHHPAPDCAAGAHRRAVVTPSVPLRGLAGPASRKGAVLPGGPLLLLRGDPSGFGGRRI
jgi:uncharacterized membrane protein YeaQ/YmgE (transglycosylase-associated protein family)